MNSFLSRLKEQREELKRKLIRLRPQHPNDWYLQKKWIAREGYTVGHITSQTE